MGTRLLAGGLLCVLAAGCAQRMCAAAAAQQLAAGT